MWINVENETPADKNISSLQTLLVCLENKDGKQHKFMSAHYHPPKGRVPGQWAESDGRLVEHLGWAVAFWAEIPPLPGSENE